MRMRTSLLSFLLAVGLTPLGVFAQPVAPAIPAAQKIQIRSVKFEADKTPEYAVSVRGGTKRDGKADWLKVTCEYDILPLWTDEVTFTFHVALDGTPANLGPERKTRNLFTGSVTYQNVKQGRHISTMFLDPNTFERFGTPLAVAVLVDVGGEAAGGKAQPETTVQWWTKEAPQAISLLRRDETPWRFVEVDLNNTIKP